MKTIHIRQKKRKPPSQGLVQPPGTDPIRGTLQLPDGQLHLAVSSPVCNDLFLINQDFQSFDVYYVSLGATSRQVWLRSV
jgi:hypothetical protein